MKVLWAEGHGAEVLLWLWILRLAEGSAEELHEPNTGVMLAEPRSEFLSAKEVPSGMEILPGLHPDPWVLPEVLVLPWSGLDMLPSVLLTMWEQRIGPVQR